LPVPVAPTITTSRVLVSALLLEPEQQQPPPPPPRPLPPSFSILSRRGRFRGATAAAAIGARTTLPILLVRKLI
jgi:hypothetical protein